MELIKTCCSYELTVGYFAQVLNCDHIMEVQMQITKLRSSLDELWRNPCFKAEALAPNTI